MSKSRLKLFGGLGLVGLIILAAAAWFLFFRDTSAASVDSTAAAEARQEAIDAAAAQATDDSGTEVATDSEAASDPADEGDTEVDVGQPDSAASVGSETDGAWQIDTSIGTFDDSCLTDVCSSSFVGFRIDEELVGFGAKTVVGRSPAVTGSIELAGTQVVAASFVVDMTQLITDQESRTDAIRGTSGGLETDAFPEAIFVLTEPIELGALPAEGTSVEVQAVGELSVHGQTQPVIFPLTAELQAGLIIVFGNLENVLLADYGIPKPSAAVVVSVEEHAIVELQLFFSR